MFSFLSHTFFLRSSQYPQQKVKPLKPIHEKMMKESDLNDTSQK
ncbi:hypothetical protein BAT_2872 [Bacillus pumilus ATCC 7061]|nr:hypothetical protein BAT_2872 [Bacillus pumilus ATCC 7061]